MEQGEKLFGLSDEEVRQRICEGKVNIASAVKTKSVKRIFLDNICTVFNLINVLLFAVLLSVGSYRNLLFILVVFFNTTIGIVQEIRSKRSVDRLTILTESKQQTLRSGRVEELPKNELVLDDIIILSRGSQVPADCTVLQGSCRANESLLTGESDLIDKNIGDELLSGSFIAAGRCFCRICRVGEDSYAAKLGSEAKVLKKNDSQMLRSFKFIINLCSAVILPIGALLFVMKYFVHHQQLQMTVESTVGALVGMIPSGMVLLTSTVLAVSVIRLARRKVLVNEMYCIETLARVDVLCLDKTGTLTAEKMDVSDLLLLDSDEAEVLGALASIAAASEEKNATIGAIAAYTGEITPMPCRRFFPFSSETKRSGGTFENGRTYLLGAAEFVFPDREKYAGVYQKIGEVSGTVRILALASYDGDMDEKTPCGDLVPMALILIKDTLRDNVCQTVRYFIEQGVTLKVISGDSVQTVRRIALDCGIDGAEKAVDLTSITTDEDLRKAADRYNVFGRVTPDQKKKLIHALRENGHKVAMTGDGVNDVLALKEADCSVAMAAGSEAARNVSQLVLVNNDFAAMPDVVAEGRRTINNIERSSSLYLVKTIYSMLLSLFFVFAPFVYPFQPIQLTLVSALTVAFPSFVLALQPNRNIVRGNFTFNILSRAAPAALCVSLSIMTMTIVGANLGISHAELSTLAVYITAFICMMLIVRLSIPMNLLRTAMLTLSGAGFAIAILFFSGFFRLSELSQNALVMLTIAGFVSLIVFNLLYQLVDKMIEKEKRKTLKNSASPV